VRVRAAIERREITQECMEVRSVRWFSCMIFVCKMHPVSS
jgi:hypothetical protein